MLLLIDAGNTRVKWAMVPSGAHVPGELGGWTASGMVEHARLLELADEWRGQNIVRVLISNVAGQAMRDALEQVLLRALGMQPVPLEWFCSAATLGGVRNAYRNPTQLGCDRFASAIGAHALFPDQPLIVATCGTATTIDAISADGVFIGGMILPGLGLMASSLASNTAQLPQVAQGLDIADPFADNTDAAIASGCIAAQAGAIERALAAHAQRSGGRVQCILSGGAAALIAPHLPAPHRRVDNLVLIGLHQVAISTARHNTSC
ncbi:type III pantothenate kinase [Noviherbaspirillum sp. UKPF54]|uniref:type III pantothenate kinase n=1 Tax=Noviherbaspirillum sp. UKPF54 TaxID=2601898 RepID=UPI0011B0F5EF|nr:type III pantothenate kinase [Noviherbaspirillum sp. UKPF54]QDZ29172.1 type III pantothenate kinase [Noviherbaspirillum sp. UKPF54]